MRNTRRQRQARFCLLLLAYERGKNTVAYLPAIRRVPLISQHAFRLLHNPINLKYLPLLAEVQITIFTLGRLPLEECVDIGFKYHYACGWLLALICDVFFVFVIHDLLPLRS